jgi:hypothetical protein
MCFVPLKTRQNLPGFFIGCAENKKIWHMPGLKYRQKNPENPRKGNGILIVKNTVSSFDADRFQG